MRKIAEFTDTQGRKARVYRDTEWNEYRVKFYNHQGIYMDASDYMTDDKQDAIGTAKYTCSE